MLNCYGKPVYAAGPKCGEPISQPGECECGCGQEVTKGRRLRRGHVFRKTIWGFIVDPDTGCWEWTGPRHCSGYGARGQIPAHRWYYEDRVGPIPDGLELDHLCYNPCCVNPQHLEPVTKRENIRRKTTTKLSMSKARAIRQELIWGTKSLSQLAREHGVTRANIAAVRDYKIWREDGD